MSHFDSQSLAKQCGLYLFIVAINLVMLEPKLERNHVALSQTTRKR
jgi:hypothetical protein